MREIPDPGRGLARPSSRFTWGAPPTGARRTGVDEGETTFRLRHIWASWGPQLAAQTNTNWMDIDTFPNVIDYWGPNGMVFPAHAADGLLRPLLERPVQHLAGLQPDQGLEPELPDRRHLQLRAVRLGQLLYTPFPQLMLDAEFLWGERKDKNGATGDDSRLQFTAKYSFSSKDLWR